MQTTPRQWATWVNLYRKQGDFVRAESHLRECLEINRKVRGEAHPEVAESLDRLAVLYSQQGDHERAEALFQQAIAIKKTALGGAHPSVLHSMNNLAALYASLENYPRAEWLYSQAMAGLKESVGESHPDFTTTLHNLAMLNARMQRYDRAEQLYGQLLKLESRILGKDDPGYANSLDSLATLYRDMGRYEEARILLEEALSIERKTVGQAHRQYADTLTKLGETLHLQKQYEPAAEAYLEALDISFRNSELAALGQSERRQLAMLADVLFRLDRLVSLTSNHPQLTTRTFQQVVRWKGMALARQRLLRKALERPDTAAVAEELRATAAQLATLSLQTPAADQREAWTRQIASLTDQKERWEAKLGSLAGQKVSGSRNVDLKALHEALPKGVALVDFLTFMHVMPQAAGVQGPPSLETRLGAFVAHHGNVIFVDLGSTRTIATAINAWRAGAGATTPAQNAGRELRQLLWLPLEKHLASAVTIVLSPDGELTKLPFAALPGKAPGSFLLEEYSIAIVPSAQSILEFGGHPDLDAPGKLLVVADVDYERGAISQGRPAALASTRAVGAATDFAFAPLPATRHELASIERLTQGTRLSLKSLMGANASEDALLMEAPQCEYLHIATHGYFAAEKFQSALQRKVSNASTQAGQEEPFDLITDQSLGKYHPGLLSGLALAGANRPTDADDGILTAEEVRTLNLSKVNLVVLSACETGLGASAGGEGLLGLQRAFQAAGARSVVATLWSVPDEATKTLMVRFYENLWQKKMTKAEALREAQLWMLRHGAEQPDISRELAARGLRPVPTDAPAASPRLPPYYWAAFILSGDWR